MPNPIVVDEVASVVPTAQIQQRRSVLLNEAPVARSGEPHVGNGRELVPPKSPRIPLAYMKCSPTASESYPWSRTGLLDPRSLPKDHARSAAAERTGLRSARSASSTQSDPRRCSTNVRTGSSNGFLAFEGLNPR